MFVEPGDSANWDVIEHEYGHYVADRSGFLAPVGGDHGFDVISKT